MESNEAQQNLSSDGNVQQALRNCQVDSGNTLIVNSVHNSIDSNTSESKNSIDSPIKDSGVDYDVDFGTDSGTEDSDISESSMIGQTSMQIPRYDPIDDKLPDTVTLLTTPDGGKVYLVGTAHFSEESQNDVSTIIQAIQPNIVMVELCEARVHVLQLDEQTVLKEAENLNMQTIRATIRQNGVRNGLLYVLLLNMSAHITRQLGMAPGGEFRRAFAEAKKIPNCLVHLGDRPINITIQRALYSLSWWQTINVFLSLLHTKEPISKEYVESCKRRDMLEELLAQMTEEFPSLGEVFVKERDIYLTHSLQLAARPYRTMNGAMPARVVGIVGIGHMKGIIEHWGKVDPSQIVPIMRIPPPSLSSKILRVTLKASFIGAVIYIGYKFIPLPSGSTLQSLKSSVEGLLKVSANR